MKRLLPTSVLLALLLLAACDNIPGNRSAAAKDEAVDEPAAEANWWEGYTLEDPRLSQPIYSETIFEPVSIAADDGAKIDAAVLRPVTPEGVKVPIIMQLSPYLAPELQPASIVLTELNRHQFVERGYAVAFVSVRGFGGSQGCPDYQGERDQQDVNAIVDTLAAQPWSNGKIGGIGLSWDGTTLNSAALAGNPNLTTIVPNASITDWYKWSFMQGVPTWIMGYTYNVYAPVAAGLVPGIVSGAQIPPAISPPCLPSMVDAVLAQYSGALMGTRNEWWDERDMVQDVDKIWPGLAVLQVQGQRDDGVRPDMLHEWDGALRARLPNYRLILGDWTHLWPDTPNQPAAYNPDFPGFNVHPLTSWPVLLLRWFDHWLKGNDTGLMAMPTALIQDSDGHWHGEDGLQPSRAVAERWYPNGEGGIAAAPASGSLAFIDAGLGVDPRGTCIYYAGGLRVGCLPLPLPTAQFFVSEPLAAETRYTGIARAHLSLTHSMPIGHVGVTLYVIKEGVWAPMTYGIASYNTRDKEQSYELRTPLGAFEQDVELIVRDFLVPAGAQLGLAIGAQVGRNPMGLTGNGFLPVPSAGISQIQFGESSWVELPKLEGPTEYLPLE